VSEAAAECPRCGVVFAKAAARPAAPEATALASDDAAPAAPEASDRLTLLAFPVTLAIGVVAALLPPTRFLVDASIGMELHELGHATVLWLGSRVAIPIPMLTVQTMEGRSVVMFLALAAFLAFAFRQCWRENCRGAAAFAAALLVLLVVLTALPDGRHDMLVDFGGMGGELWLAALLVIAWFHPLPERVRWGRLRHAFLLAGMLVFARNAILWLRVQHHPEEIPWGSFWGDEGDMDSLVDAHGWTARDIQLVYLRVGIVCFLAMAAQWAVAALPAWVRMKERREG
jgi:hypothetical protein